MGKCTEQATLYEDITFCQGQKSLPGTRNHIFGISKKDIISFPTIDRSTKKALGTIAVYDGNFTLVADKHFHKLEMVPNEGHLQVESQGAYGSKTFKVTGSASLPGTEEAVTGYIADANNDEMIYLFPQRNGKYRMIGSEEFTPEISLKQDLGKATTDSNVTTLEIVSDDEYPAPFYPGNIDTADGIISGADGKVVKTDTPKT